ncbi:MAG: sigma-70 family RNA polymerase sigma factor [Gammaproteobacteria bacterium]
MSNVVKLPGEPLDATAAERAAETSLLEQVRDSGDRAAFEKLFAIFTPRLLAWMRAQGTDVAAAESVVQEVMITAWTRAALFDAGKASARTWMYTLARNRLIDHHRGGARRARAHDDFTTLAPGPEDTGEAPEREWNSSRMADLLGELPVEQREILLLVYVEGHSHRAIAERLGLPIGTVKSRTRLAFNRLRKRLEEIE